MTVEEANYELDNYADEVLIHLKIWNLIDERQEKDIKDAERRAKNKSRPQ